jgi:hypothetical protein
MTDPLAPHLSSAAELKARLAAEREGGPVLIWRGSEGDQRILHLAQSSVVTIGRATANTVVLDWDDEVSRVHAELTDVGGAWTLRDDGLSRNGTRVNGRMVSSRQRLDDGDRIGIGQTVLVFQAPGLGESGPTVKARSGEYSALGALSPAQLRVLVALCRPYKAGAHALPPTNQAIADEIFVSVETVKAHLRTLFERFGIEDLPQNQKRARLIEMALESGTVSYNEL